MKLAPTKTPTMTKMDTNFFCIASLGASSTANLCHEIFGHVVQFLVEMEASAGVGCYCKSSKPAIQDEQQIKYVVEKKIERNQNKTKNKDAINMFERQMKSESQGLELM